MSSRSLSPYSDASSPSVLIVDPSADNREVLKTVLERRGLRIFESDRPVEGLQLVRDHHPDVVVVDFEAQAAEEEWPSRYAAESLASDSRLIILGRLSASDTPAEGDASRGRIIAKPYHFAPLVHTIEQLAAKAA